MARAQRSLVRGPRYGGEMMDVMCIGDLVVDIFVKGVRDVPPPFNFTMPEAAQVHTGGDAVNTAIDLAKLGLNAGVIGRVGSDDSGEFLIGRMKDWGVNANGVVKGRSAGTSVCFFIISPEGTESYWYYRGASLEFAYEDVDLDLVKQAKIVLITGSYLIPAFDGEPTAKVLKAAKENGQTTAVDPSHGSIDGDWTTIEPVLPYTDIFLPNLDQAEAMSGVKGPEGAADYFLSKGIKTVAIKMDERGCLIKTAEKCIRLPAYEVEVVDMAGAGDAYVAGFLAGVLKGWDLSLTGKFANAVAAVNGRVMGCSSGVLPFEDAMKFMESAQVRKA